jgi:mitochondrial fission protein ELM1
MHNPVTNHQRISWSPKVWVLRGNRAGENSQTSALAEALGWPAEVKRIHHRSGFPYFLLDASLAGVDLAASDLLQGPWPDVVITAGACNEPVAKWIRRQASKPVRLVHVGRTWGSLDDFDLVVTTPQYRLPEHPKVLHNPTTLHSVSEPKFDAAARHWAPRLQDLPQPYFAVVVGGHSGPYSFDRAAARRLGRQAGEMARAAGGSLLITTSSRTPKHVVESLYRAVDCPMFFHEWSPGATDNPYFGFLALADAIVVTGDSIAMLSEAAATHKPVHIFDLGEGRHAMRRSAPVPRPRSLWTRLAGLERDHLRAWFYRMAMHTGPKRLTRDIGIVHDYLIRSGRAVWLGDHFPDVTPLPSNSVARTVARVERLFGPLSEAAYREENAAADLQAGVLAAQGS